MMHIETNSELSSLLAGNQLNEALISSETIENYE